MSVKRMSGTPWHVSVLGKGNGERRGRTSCRYYIEDTGMCRIWNESCSTMSHCDEYSRKSTKSKNQMGSKKEKTKEPIMLPSAKTAESPVFCPIRKGDVAHSKQYGKGIVEHVDSNRLSIRFSESLKKYSYPGCLKSITFNKK